MTSIQYHYIIGKQCVTNLHYNSTTGISVRENLCSIINMKNRNFSCFQLPKGVENIEG